MIFATLILLSLQDDAALKPGTPTLHRKELRLRVHAKRKNGTITHFRIQPTLLQFDEQARLLERWKPEAEEVSRRALLRNTRASIRIPFPAYRSVDITYTMGGTKVLQNYRPGSEETRLQWIQRGHPVVTRLRADLATILSRKKIVSLIRFRARCRRAASRSAYTATLGFLDKIAAEAITSAAGGKTIPDPPSEEENPYGKATDEGAPPTVDLSKASGEEREKRLSLARKVHAAETRLLLHDEAAVLIQNSLNKQHPPREAIDQLQRASKLVNNAPLLLQSITALKQGPSAPDEWKRLLPLLQDNAKTPVRIHP